MTALMEEETVDHVCSPPMHERRFYLPLGDSGQSPRLGDQQHMGVQGELPASLRPKARLHRVELVPAGERRAVWQCDRCAAVWVVQYVAIYGPMTSRGRRHQIGLKRQWEKAGPLRAWRERRKFRNNLMGG